MKNLDDVKFLHTISLFGGCVLVPINRIKFINFSESESSFEIKIESDDGNWIECFSDEEKACERFNSIKNMIKAEL